MSNSFEITEFLASFDITDATIEKIEQLEDYIEEANHVANLKTGELLVVDAIYDELVDTLKKVRPDSPLLMELWEDEDQGNTEGNKYTALLQQAPMKSIITAKDLDTREMDDFLEKYPDVADLHFSMKLNGWAVRVVYEDGAFVSATSRARSSAGRDLTPQLTTILEREGLVDLSDYLSEGLTELRGELVLPFHRLETARQYNPTIVSAFSGVASMMRDSASEDEWSLIDFVAFNIIGESDDLEFDTQTDLYTYLDELGMKTPEYWSVEDVTSDELLEVVQDVLDEISEDIFDENTPYEYFTDGVVMQLDDFEQFQSMGGDIKHNYGNIALKIGDWKQDNYYGYVQYIEYSKGKNKLSPVAIISEQPNQAIFEIDDVQYVGFEELFEHWGVEIQSGEILPSNHVINYNDLGVATISGNRVRRVPVYEPANLFVLRIEANTILHFKYGGEAGVVPCFEDGTLLKTKTIDHVDALIGYLQDY